MTKARKMPAQKPGKSFQSYATPLAFVETVEREIIGCDFALDLAATKDNTKAPRWLGPGSPIATDSLKADWAGTLDGDWGFLNPPYAHIRPWVEKCADEAKKGARFCLLVPASVGADWFARYVHRRSMVLALLPRLSFDGKAPFPKDTVLCVYGQPGRGFDCWRWKP
jgi:phage N-6-adenine-methyltransferase